MPHTLHGGSKRLQETEWRAPHYLGSVRDDRASVSCVPGGRVALGIDRFVVTLTLFFIP